VVAAFLVDVVGVQGSPVEASLNLSQRRCADFLINLHREEDVMLWELTGNSVNDFADWRGGAVKVQALRFIQRRAPRRRDKGDDTSIRCHSALTKKPCIVTVNEFDPLVKNREVAMREFEHLWVGFEGDALCV